MSVYAENLLRELVRMGHDVTMVSQYRGDAAGKGVYGGGPPPEVPGVRVIGLEARGEQDGGNFEKDVEEMTGVIEAEHRRSPFDAIHAQYAYPTGLAALEASRRTGVPNAVSIQGGDGHWVGTCCPTHKKAMLAVLGHAGALLIGSRSFAGEVSGNHGTPPERFTIVPGAVDTGTFHPADRPTGSLSEPPTLLYHGRVDRRKGVLDLINAFAALADRTPARLTVSGIGPDLEEAARLSEDLGLADRIRFTGHVGYHDAPAVYRAADVFVSPTYGEGFSNTILEAMATGLPVVSTRAVGVVDCLRHGENALLVEPGDVDALAETLRCILDDRALRVRLAEQGLGEARTLYAWHKAARRITGVYEALLGTRPDTDWSADGPVAPCRFRDKPHLL